MFRVNFSGFQKRLCDGGFKCSSSITFKRNIADFLAYKNGLVKKVRAPGAHFDKLMIFARKYADCEMRYRRYPKRINIIEVGPTCGLDEKKKSLYKNIKVDFVNRLNETGLKNVQVVDFSRRFFSPNMKDGRYVNERLNEYIRPSDVVNSMIIPTIGTYNREMFVNKNINEIVLNLGITDSYNRFISSEGKESVFKSMEEILLVARDDGLRVRGGVSGNMGGMTSENPAVDVMVECVERFDRMGVDCVDVVDTSVEGGSRVIFDIVDRCLNRDVSPSKMAVQIRDNEVDGLLKVAEFLDRGIVNYRTCLMGLETGILSTEKLINFCKRNEIDFGDVDINKLLQTSFWVNRFFKF